MDRRLPFLYGALLSTIILAALHQSAISFYFYWIYWWFDVITHFLGGFTGGLATYWVLFHSGHVFRGRFESRVVTGISVLFCVMVAGIAWELFEYIYNIKDSHEGYQLDVLNDLILDGSGAILAAMIGLRNKNG